MEKAREVAETNEQYEKDLERVRDEANKVAREQVRLAAETEEKERECVVSAPVEEQRK